MDTTGKNRYRRSWSERALQELGHETSAWEKTKPLPSVFARDKLSSLVRAERSFYGKDSFALRGVTGDAHAALRRHSLRNVGTVWGKPNPQRNLHSSSE